MDQPTTPAPEEQPAATPTSPLGRIRQFFRSRRKPSDDTTEAAPAAAEAPSDGAPAPSDSPERPHSNRARHEPRQPREPRDPNAPPREPRPPRDPNAPRGERRPRDPNAPPREPREPRDPNAPPREPRPPRDPNEPRGERPPRDPNAPPREPRPPRDPNAPPREPRPPRENRDSRPPREEREPREPRTQRPVAQDLPPEEALEPLPVVTEGETLFHTLGLGEPVLRAVLESGYSIPSEIQLRAIPILLSGKDLIGASQTGTGKTAAFALPMLTRLARHRRKGPRALIIEPTRELAQQVRVACDKYAKHLDLRFALLHGGVSHEPQRKELYADADVVISTPGRLLDFLEGRDLTLRNVEYLVLDEGDRMLDLGFMPDVRRIIGQCPRDGRQSLLFSATAPSQIQRLAEFMLKDPERVAISTGTKAADTVRHVLLPVDDRQKFDLLTHLLKTVEYKSVIIFSRTKVGADMIGRWLEQTGHEDVGVIHADRSQKQREQALAAFKEGKLQILVATDIMSRGIDITGVTHVINYDIPENSEDYVHRIGRTGRMRQEGDAYSLYSAMDQSLLQSIERLIGQEIPREKLEGFDYTWSPILDEKKAPAATKRNRGFAGGPVFGGKKRR